MSRANAKFTPEESLARLRALLARTPRGVELSHREIAAAVGCTWQCIWHIEQRALKKLGLSPELRRHT